MAALIQALLVPGVQLWHKGVGCVWPTEDLNQFQLFGACEVAAGLIAMMQYVEWLLAGWGGLLSASLCFAWP